MTHIASTDQVENRQGFASPFFGGNSREGMATRGRAGPIIKSGFAWVTSLKRALSGEAVNHQLLLVVTSELAVMLAAGCDLCAGLECLAKQEAHPTLKATLVDLHEGVKGGESFSHALSRHPEVFSDVYVALVRAGESTGLLKHMLKALQIMMSNQMRVAGSVRSALTYPLILICVGIGAIVVMTTFVLPRFALLFEQSNIPIPAVTKFVLHSSKYVSSHFMLLGLMVVGLAVAAVWLANHPVFRPGFQKWVLTIPVLGITLRLAYVCRSIQAIGMLTKSGLPLVDTLALTRDMMPNIHYWQFFDRTRQHISEGKQLSADFRASTLFPLSVAQMVSVGEETGTMAHVCLEISAFQEEVLQARIKTIVTALEPIIILGMGGFVGFIAVSVILPMFKLSSSVH